MNDRSMAILELKSRVSSETLFRESENLHVQKCSVTEEPLTYSSYFSLFRHLCRAFLVR